MSYDFSTESMIIDMEQSIAEQEQLLEYYEIIGRDTMVETLTEALTKSSEEMYEKTKKSFSGAQIKLHEKFRNNKKFIEKYGEKALSNNLTGLEMQIPTAVFNYNAYNKIIKVIDDYANEVVKLSNKAKDMDKDEVNKEIEKIKAKYQPQLNKLAHSIDYTVVETVKVDKKLVKTCVDFLKNGDSDITKSRTNTAKLLNTVMRDSLLPSFIVSKMTKFMHQVVANKSMYESSNMNERLSWSKRIVKTAANYNPRQLKESYNRINDISDEFIMEQFNLLEEE